ncbi:hypothetical protein [Nocardia pseudovaccinii]|uniref:hypothetical protein n=1 Tax=Nocardia pseudovaccinii TaxID=189540 RepID=UPI0007A4E04D|nr:hypothetical protein [Nocardia pseudovaccinii]
MTSEGWFPTTGNVHLRVWLADMAFDYTATAVAVPNLIEDWMRKHWYTIELIHDTTDDYVQLPHLPCERLFLGP